MPPWALAVAETHPRGLTGRVGAGQRPGLPRDEARFSSRRLGRNPPSGTQSLGKTLHGNRMVALSDKNFARGEIPALRIFRTGPVPPRRTGSGRLSDAARCAGSW